MNKLNKFISLNFNKIITFILIFNPIIDLLNSIFINNLHLNFTFGVVVRIFLSGTRLYVFRFGIF